MTQNIHALIRRFAKRAGLSEQEVLAEMQLAIDAGYHDPDPAVQAQWAAMPFRGKPTPEELILFLSQKMLSEEKQDKS